MADEYSKEKLERAKSEIEQLTPEEWIALQDYVLKLEKGWPEVPASVNLKVVAPNGIEEQWTIRDFDDDMLHERHARLVSLLEEDGYVPQRTYVAPSEYKAPKASSPKENEALIITTPGVTQDILDKGGYESYPVESIIHMKTAGKAISYVVVKGGSYKAYGYKAWPEVFPGDFVIDKYPNGKELPPPASMRVAYLDKEAKKIVAFLGVYE